MAVKRLLLVLALLSLPAWATIALDGTPVHKNVTSGSSFAMPAFTTSSTNDLVILSLTVNGVTGSSITSANTSGWTLRKRQTVTTQTIETWVGTATAALTAEVITVNLSGATTFATTDLWAVSGADTTTKFDSNVSLPASAGGAGTDPIVISTSNANDFIFGCYRMAGTASPTAGAGWTIISGADFQLCEYKVVSATQSSLSVTIGTGVGDANGGIADALIASSAVVVAPQIAGTAQLAGTATLK